MASRTVYSSSPICLVQSGALCARASPNDPAIHAAPPHAAIVFKNSRRSVFIDSPLATLTERRLHIRQALADFLLRCAQPHVLVIHICPDGILLVAQQSEHLLYGRIARAERLVPAAVSRAVFHDEMRDLLVIFLNVGYRFLVGRREVSDIEIHAEARRQRREGR